METFSVYFILFAIAFSIFCFALVYNEKFKKEEELKRQKKIEEQNEREKEQAERKRIEKERESLYGKCSFAVGDFYDTKTGNIKDVKALKIYEESKTLIISKEALRNQSDQDMIIKISDILGFTSQDYIPETAKSSTTEHSTSDMAKRAAVGGMLFGATGAAVGALTSKSVTREDNQSIEFGIHKFLFGKTPITINLRSLQNPFVEIMCRTADLEKVCATLNTIVEYAKAERAKEQKKED